MARVKGIISAGLASALTNNVAASMHERATVEGEREANRQVRIDQRIERMNAADQSSAAGDTAASLVGGLAAGSIFGGPAGLLVFGVSKLLQDRKRQGIAAYRAYVAETAEDRIAAAESALDTLEEQAQTDGELASVRLKRAELDSLRVDMQSLDPEISSKAIIAAQGLVGNLDDEFDDWEAERLEAEKVAREQDELLFQRSRSLDGAMQAQSARYIAANETWQKARLAYERPNPQSDMALVYLTAQMIDPGAIVTDGDSKMIRSTGSLSQQMAGYLNSLIDGTSGFDDAVRDGLMSVIAENYQVMRTQQLERNATFQGLGQQAKLSGEYLKKLQVPIDPTEAQDIYRFRQFVPEGAGIPYEGNPNAAELREKRPGALSREVASGVQGISQFGGEVSRTLRGVRRYVDEETGAIIEVDADGKKTQVGIDEQWKQRQRLLRGGRVYPIERGRAIND